MHPKMSDCCDCGRETPWTHDDEPMCVQCAVSAMAHGHQHVHDEPDDCELTLWSVGGTFTVRCPEPREPEPEPADEWCVGCGEAPQGRPTPRYGEPEPGLCWRCSDAVRREEWEARQHADAGLGDVIPEGGD